MQAFINRHGQNTGRVEQMAKQVYIEGKAEYSSKWAWSSIGKQYPEGLTRGVIQYTRQNVKNQTTRQHKKTRLTKIINENYDWLRKAANTQRVKNAEQYRRLNTKQTRKGLVRS